MENLDIAKAAAEALENKKGEDVKIILYWPPETTETR